jgi:hypothetical protein
MPKKRDTEADVRKVILEAIMELADRVVFGTISETYRTCGRATCSCHTTGPKHGPHMYISYRGDGKTTGYYVPVAAQEEVRAGVAAWQAVQQRLRELAELNRQAIISRAKDARRK